MKSSPTTIRARIGLWRVAAAAVAFGCSRSPSTSGHVQFGPYQDSDQTFRFDAPLNWNRETNRQGPDQPMISVFFRGSDRIDGRTIPIDVALSVTKLARQPQAFPTPQDYDRFRRNTLLQVDALFGPPDPELKEPLRSMIAKNSKDVTLDGIPGKQYRRDYDYMGTAKTPPLAVSVEDVVLRTTSSYYVLEYRARRDLFDKYHFAAERLQSSFHPGRG